MADVTINGLDDISVSPGPGLSGTDEFEIQETGDGSSYKTTLDDIKSFALSAYSPGMYNINVMVDYSALNDGTETTTEVGNAFAAATDKTIIYFPPGIYKMDQVSITGYDDLVILGYGATILGDVGYAQQSAFSFTDCQRVTIKGFKFDRLRSTRKVSDLDAIDFTGCIDITVQDCNFYDVYNGINLFWNVVSPATRCERIDIKDNFMSAREIVNSTNYGENELPNYLVYAEWTRQLLVKDNILDGANLVVFERVSSNDQICEFNVVTSNIVENSPGTAIWALYGIVKSTIHDNVLINNGNCGIKLLGRPWNQVSIAVNTNIIQGAGEVDNASARLIWIDNTLNSVFTGNILTWLIPGPLAQISYAMWFRACQDCIINYNNIYNPHTVDVYTAGLGATKGIVIESGGSATGNAERLSIIGNNIRGCPDRNIWFLVNGYAIIDCKIEDNILSYPDGYSEADYVLNIAAGTSIERLTIKNNNISAWNITGLLIQGTNDLQDITIESNYFRDSDSSGNESIYFTDFSAVSGYNSSNIILRHNKNIGSQDFLNISAFPDIHQFLTIEDNNITETGIYNGCYAITTPTFSILENTTNARFSNENGDSGGCEVFLPSAVVGADLTFISVDDYDITITPVTGEEIGWLAAGVSGILSTKNSKLVLHCYEAGKWSITTQTGTFG